MTFLLAEVPLILLDRKTMPDRGMYRVFVYLANAVYYLNYGLMTEEIIDRAEQNTKRFSNQWCKVCGKKRCIPKFHRFQHFVELVRRHGPAFLWDTFNMERGLGLKGKTVTACVNQVEQVSLNVLTKLHCPLLYDIESYKEPAQNLLKTLGFDNTKFAEMRISILDTKTSEEGVSSLAQGRVNADDAEPFMSFLQQEQQWSDDYSLNRVKRVRIRNLTLSSNRYKHTGKVRDCYVCLNGTDFGQIADMCEVRQRGKFLLRLQKYEKVVLRNSDDHDIILPVNQFPVRPTDTFVVFELNDDLFIQKSLWVDSVPVRDRVLNFMCLRPNEWFEH